MTVLDSFSLMATSEVSDFTEFKEITDILEQWNPYAYKHNREESDDAQNDAFVKAVNNRTLNKKDLDRYMVKTMGFFKQNNKIRRSSLVENLEDYVSNDRRILGKDSQDSLLTSDTSYEEIEEFLSNSELVNTLEYLLITNTKDFIFLMEDLIHREDLSSYRVSGIPKRDVNKYFDNPKFIEILQEIAYLTTGFFSILIYYYMTYKDTYNLIANIEDNTHYNNYVTNYTNTLCYIIDDTIYNRSIFGNTYIVDREKLVNKIFDMLFDDKNKYSLEYKFENTIFYRLLDNNFYYETQNLEELVKTQIRNIIMLRMDKKNIRFVGEIDNYDIFVSKAEEIKSFDFSLGGEILRFEIEKA